MPKSISLMSLRLGSGEEVSNSGTSSQLSAILEHFSALVSSSIEPLVPLLLLQLFDSIEVIDILHCRKITSWSKIPRKLGK